MQNLENTHCPECKTGAMVEKDCEGHYARWFDEWDACCSIYNCKECGYELSECGKYYKSMTTRR